MGTFHREMWLSEGSGQSRRQRRSGAFQYYVPTRLEDLDIQLEPDVVGDVARAERAILELDGSAKALRSSEGIARLLLRAEAISSSHIEGLQIGTRRLLRAEMNLSGDYQFGNDEPAAEVVGNIYAMQNALDTAQASEVVSVGTILGIHSALCRGSKIERFGGKIRDMQNWVGGSSYNPLEAEYVPPAPEYVVGLLDDLARFSNDDVISPVLQAALVHAQFETIHPFVDGNGRTGRALIHLILRRRGISRNLVPPISLVLATHSKSYVQALTSFRFADDAPADRIREGLNDWVSFFAGACTQACEEAMSFENRALVLEEGWRERLGKVRRNSALDKILSELAGAPLFTVGTMSQIVGCSFAAASIAVDRLLEAGVVAMPKRQARNRVFEVPEAINEFNIFERRLASPAGDTRVEKPVRVVPENLSKKTR